jgi:hypothetical protein
MHAIAAVIKKNAGDEAGVGILFRKTNRFFREKAALPDTVRFSGQSREERCVRLLSIKFG